MERVVVVISTTSMVIDHNYGGYQSLWYSMVCRLPCTISTMMVLYTHMANQENGQSQQKIDARSDRTVANELDEPLEDRIIDRVRVDLHQREMLHAWSRT